MTANSANALPAAERRILIGQIGPAHGVKGEVIVHSYAAVPEDIAEYGALTDAQGRRSFAITGLKVAGQRLVARFVGVTDRNAAEALRGTELYVARSHLPAAADGEWYQADLVGLAVVDANHSAIGTVVAVVNYGAGDLLEIKPVTGEATLLLPFNDSYVPTVDIAAGQVTVIMPIETGDDLRETDMVDEDRTAGGEPKDPS